VPLVSVGIPTYNRLKTLVHAIKSVLMQEYEGTLEIIITDNASTDKTEEYCRTLSAKDNRIRYFRQPHNMGPLANFQTSIENAQGEFFMWLADDDWIESPNYIQCCSEALLARPDYTRVCGKIRYSNEGGVQFYAPKFDVTQDSPARRVCSYYSQVNDNGIYYGLTRTKDLQRVRFKNTVGSDWLFVAGIAFLGKILTIEDVCLARDYRPSADGFGHIGRVFKLSKFEVQHPYTSIAMSVFKDIAWESDVYSTLSLVSRYYLATKCSLIVGRHWMYPRFTDPLSTKVRSHLTEGQRQFFRRLYKHISK